MRTLFLLTLLLAAYVSARAGGRRREHKEQIKEKISTLSCDQKAEVLDAKVDMNFERMGELLGMQISPRRDANEKKRAEMATIKERIEGKTCEEKSVILTAILDNDRAKLKELGVLSPSNQQVKQVIKEEIADMTCEEKTQVFDAFLNVDNTRLTELLGQEISLQQPKDSRKIRKKERMMQSIKRQVEGKTCEEKVAVFNALLDSDRQTLKDLGIRINAKRPKGRKGKNKGHRGRAEDLGNEESNA